MVNSADWKIAIISQITSLTPGGGPHNTLATDASLPQAAVGP